MGKVYKGWEVVKIAEEGGFKEGTILKDSANKYQIRGHHIYVCTKDNEKIVDCWNLINNHFEILKNEGIDIQEIEELKKVGVPMITDRSDISHKFGTNIKYEYEINTIGDKVNEIIRAVNKMNKEIHKEYCKNCGDELTKENKYMDGMCMECKCGIDWEDK